MAHLLSMQLQRAEEAKMQYKKLKAKLKRYNILHYSIDYTCVRTLLHAGVSGHEFQLEITFQSSSRIFLELDWAVDRKLD